MEIIKRYQEQYEEFVRLDDFNLEQRAMRVPAEKHFWVARLIDAKIERERLYKQKAATKHTLQKKVMEEALVAINKQILDEVDKSPSLDAINQKIKEQEFLIEYLERLVSQVTYIAQDIKNIIEIKKLEELG
jgi:hypothetical protein